MRKLLIALNVLLLLAIFGAAFFWHPEPAERPLPGTYAEKLGRDIPPDAVSTPAAGQAGNLSR